MKSITTKGQRKKLYAANPGYGWITFNSGNGEVTEIEVYVSRDNVLRRVGNGQPLFPIQITDPDEGLISVKSEQDKDRKLCHVCKEPLHNEMLDICVRCSS